MRGPVVLASRRSRLLSAATSALLLVGLVGPASIDAAPTVLVVDSASDPGDGVCAAGGCTLREAITASNATPGAEEIRFDLPVGGSTIRPTTALPGIDGPVLIDGRPVAGDPTPTTVVLDGSLTGATTAGLTIPGTGVTVRALTIQAFGRNGIHISGHDNAIGGPADGDGNRIIDNGRSGIAVAPGDLAVGNAFIRNELTGNHGRAINLGDRDPDLLDTVGYPVGGSWPYTGPNRGQLSPSIDPVVPGATEITGKMFGRSGETNRIDVYWAPGCTPLRTEARTWLGSVDVSFPNLNSPPVPFSLPVAPVLPGAVTATTTSAAGDTSELYPCTSSQGPVDVGLQPLGITPSPVAVGGTVRVTMTVGNAGPSDAAGMLIGLGWPIGRATAGTVSGGRDCETLDDVGDGVNSAVLCSTPPIPNGTTALITVDLRATVLGPLDLFAVVAPTNDASPDDDQVTGTVSVVAGAATEPGTGVVVQAVDADAPGTSVGVTFGTVTVAGVTTVDVGTTPATPIPGNFQIGTPPTYLDLHTTAVSSGPITVCVGYDPGAFADETALRLLHFDAGAWVDTTSSLDTVGNVVCGTTASLSPFAVAAARPVWAFSGFYAPVDPSPVLNRVKAGSAVPVKFALGGDRGRDIFATGSPSVEAMICPNAVTDDIEATVAATANTLSYDASSGRYTYVWKTDKAWGGSCRQLVLTFRDGTVARARFQLTK